jgi:predicted house-cleaning noncanonical NTP pyrophosphatase (MazG superfamily)
MIYSNEQLHEMLKESVEHYQEKIEEIVSSDILTIFLSSETKIHDFKTVDDFMKYGLDSIYEDYDYFNHVLTVEEVHAEKIRDRIEGVIAGYGYEYSVKKLGKGELMYRLKKKEPTVLDYAKNRKRADMYAYKYVMRELSYGLAIDMYQELMRKSFFSVLECGGNQLKMKKQWQKEKLRRIL